MNEAVRQTLQESAKLPPEPDTFDVRSSLLSIANAARLNKTIVFATTAATLALVTAYILFWPPVYETTAMVMVERDADPARDTFYVGWNVFRKDDARTEIELMTSAPVLLEVIEKERLTYDDVYHPFLSHATYLWQKSWVGRQYRNCKEWLLGAPKTTIDPKLLEKVRTAVDLRAGIRIEPIGESNAGRLTLKGPTDDVARVANRLLQVYMQRRVDRYYTEARRAYDILSAEMEAARRQLKAVEDRRLAFLESHGLMFDFQKETLDLSKLSEVEQNIQSAQVRIASLISTLQQLNAELARQPRTQPVSTTYEANAMRESTKMKRRELELLLVQLKEKYRQDSPEVTEVQRQIQNLDALIAASSERVEKALTEGVNPLVLQLLEKRVSLEAELAGAQSSLAVMQESRQRLRERLLSIPTMQAELRSIDRDLGLAQEKYQQVLARQTQAAVSLTTTQAAMPSMRVVEYAMPPLEKAQPKLKIIYPAAFAVGLTLGIVAALFKTYASGKLRRDQMVGGRGDAPYYGCLPLIAHRLPIALPPAERWPANSSGGS